MSKRDELKAKRKRQLIQQRLTVIGIIVVGAVLIAAFLIIPNLPKPVGTFTVPTPVAYQQVTGNSMGDPNAPVKLVIYADFQCPACGNWTKENEPDFIAKYVAPKKFTLPTRRSVSLTITALAQNPKMPQPRHCVPWIRGNSGNITICCMRTKPARIRVIFTTARLQPLLNHWVSIQASSIPALTQANTRTRCCRIKPKERPSE